MKRFAELFDALDATTSTNAKVAAMRTYFSEADPSNAAWALFFLTGRRLKRFISSAQLRQWTMEETGFAPWLMDESYASVGDTAECCALLLDRLEREQSAVDVPLCEWMERRLLPLSKLDVEKQKESVKNWWRELDTDEVFILNKLMTGSFRVGVSQTLVARALAEMSDLEPSEIAHRLMGEWKPEQEWFRALVDPAALSVTSSRPYPFFLASQLEGEADALGPLADWQAEWKWDGIRAQLIRRAGESFLWSRGEDLITDRFPEIAEGSLTLPDGCVLDGEVLAFRDGKPLPFAALQTRIGRKKLTKSVLDSAPVVFMAYDLLELGGQDLRSLPLAERRAQLKQVLSDKDEVFRISEIVNASSWEDLTSARECARALAVEGLMLKRKSSSYQAGRRRGDWWKWKIDPLTVDAVLIYAQAGTGRRASLFTDYTFAVRDGEHLVPVAKAYSGLSDEEIARLDNWIRRHTRERFGPVRSVDPVHVFEIAFEGINASPRHKSGVALRFPRILRWREDKKPEDADSLESLKRLIDVRH